MSSVKFKTNHKINQLISAIDKQTPEAFCQRAPIAMRIIIEPCDVKAIQFWTRKIFNKLFIKSETV